jgi:hypothetical protein
LHRHVVAGKRHHAGAEREMKGVKRGFKKGCIVHEAVSGSALTHLLKNGAFGRRPRDLSPLCPDA